jgi:hypothetical protein
VEGTRIPKKVFKAKFEGVRSVGKPRKRWEDALQLDAARFLRCSNWKLAADDGTLWRQKIQEAKADLDCSAIGWMDRYLSVATDKRIKILCTVIII